MITVIYSVSIFLLIVSALIYCYRLIKGPHVLDRAVIVELSILLGISLFSLLYLKNQEEFLIDVLMVWCLMPFVGTLCLTQYLLRGKK